MKTTKQGLDNFTLNALSKNEKRNILGKGDGILSETIEIFDVVILSTSANSLPADPLPTDPPPTGTTPPGGVKGYGDGRICILPNKL